MRKLLLFALLFLAFFLVGPAFAQTSANSLVNATATGAGATIPLSSPYSQVVTATINFATAAPNAQTTVIEGSNDGGAHWYTLYTSTTTTYTDSSHSGEAVSFVNMNWAAIRCNLTAYTQGLNAGITCNIQATRQ